MGLEPNWDTPYLKDAIALWEEYGPKSIKIAQAILAKPLLAPRWKKYWFAVGIELDKIDRGEYTSTREN